MTAHFINQTTDPYPCVNCGADDYTVIRQDASNPRLKCNRCKFTYNGADSLAAEEAGAIPTSSAETLASADEPLREHTSTNELQAAQPRIDVRDERAAYASPMVQKIPKSPAYVFISKRRDRVEYATEKDVKAVALRWESEGPNYDVFALAPKKFEVTLEIE